MDKARPIVMEEVTDPEALAKARAQHGSSASTTMHHMPQTVSGETLAQCLSHLTPNERAGLAAFIHRLHQDYGANLLRVILFGSKARGDFDDQSDLDVLVVVHMSDEDYWQHWRRIVDMAWEVELAYSLVISSIIKNEHDYTKLCEHRSLLARNIERDGIALWTMSPNACTSQPI
jgi:predicted nucleotidyltransferase